MGSWRSDKENKEAIDTALCFCNSNSRDLNRNRNKYRRQKPLTVAEDKTAVRNCYSKQQADKQPFLFHFLDCENEKLQVVAVLCAHHSFSPLQNGSLCFLSTSKGLTAALTNCKQKFWHQIQQQQQIIRLNAGTRAHLGLHLGCDQTALLEQLPMSVHLVAKWEKSRGIQKVFRWDNPLNWNSHGHEV